MIEQFNSLAREQKLQLLYKVETYINAIWPVAEKHANLVVEKEEKEKTLKKDFENIGGGKTAVGIFLSLSIVLFLVWLILPAGFLNFMAMFCLIPSVLITIVSFFLVPGYKKTYEVKVSRLKELETLIIASEKELEIVKQQHIDAFSVWYALCRECKSPRDIRGFIYYFESGRVDSLKEAKNLLMQEQFQGRLEKLSKEQIAAANAAQRAAERAENAAHSAKTAATDAATQARWAANEARKD